MKQITPLILFLLLAASCAKAPPPTREESLAIRNRQIEMTQRFYPGKTKEDVLVAANTLFYLMDGSDFTIQHSEKGMYAERRWTVILLLVVLTGVDYWYLETEDRPNGTLLTARTLTTTNSHHVAVTSGGQLTQGTAPSPETMNKNPEVYKLFFDRMDYLLGNTTTWNSCSEERKHYGRDFKLSSLDPLCLYTDDDYPEGYVPPKKIKKGGLLF